MSNTLQKFTLNDIKVGMTIHDKEQLSNILDTWIILYKKPEQIEWTIGFIGKDIDEQTDKSYRNCGNDICPIFNDSIDAEGDIYYEE